MRKMRRKTVDTFVPSAQSDDDDERVWLETEAGLNARHAADQPDLPEDLRLTVQVTIYPRAVPTGYAPRLTGEQVLRTMVQRTMVMVVLDGLRRADARLLDGTAVSQPAHAIQWIIEQLAIGLPSSVLDTLLGETIP